MADPGDQRWHARRASAYAAVLVAGAVLLAGCAQVPVDGPVAPGPKAGADGISSVRIEALSPEPGATPEQIVQGYLDAMSTYEIGFSRPKEFLTRAAGDAWVLSPIVVYDSPEIAASDGSTVLFRAQRIADIGVDGQYTALSPGTPLEVVLPLVQEAGEWRISAPPPGLMIDTLGRDNDYSSYVTYYPSPSADILVPDVVWLPGSGEALATTLAQALVDGPTSRLGDAVRNAFPEGTSVDAVTIDSAEIATVALSGPIVAADAAARQTMAAQLAYTLRGLTVRGVVLTADGEPLVVPGVPGVLSASAFADRDPLYGLRDPAAYALIGDRLVTLGPADGRSTPVEGPLGVSALGARSVAISLDESLAATVGANGRTMATQRLDGSLDPPLQTFTGVDLATPSWDRFGNLWVVDRTAVRGSSVYVISPEGIGAAAAIDAPALEAVRVLSLRVAPDGARVAVSVLGEDETTRLLFLRVVRTDAAVALTGVALPAVLPDLEAVGDLAWAAETNLAVVVTAPDRAAQPAIVRVDGSAVSPEVQTGVTAVAAYALEPLLAVSDNATLRRRVSAITWETLGEGTAVTYPG